MKKIIILLYLILLILFRGARPAKAAEVDYNGYPEIIMESGKLLANFTDKEYKEYYTLVDKRRFWGWQVNVINRNVPCTYIARTVYETSNESKEAVTYEVSVTTETETKTSISASGDLGYEMKGASKRFKHDLDAKISLDYKYQNTKSHKRTEKLKIPVEGKTRLLVIITGSGYITNGVAAYYMGFMQVERGGFEYFTITNEFQKIEKVIYD